MTHPTPAAPVPHTAKGAQESIQDAIRVPFNVALRAAAIIRASTNNPTMEAETLSLVGDFLRLTPRCDDQPV